MELVEFLRHRLYQVTSHGSLRDFLHIFFTANDLRLGTLVGDDKYGNKYYEDNKQFFGHHQWVIYTMEMNGKNTFWDVDESMVPPEWHHWLHCMTDDPPTTKPLTAHKVFWANHKFNVSGTNMSLIPPQERRFTSGSHLTSGNSEDSSSTCTGWFRIFLEFLLV
ncbi:Ndufa12 [Phodopus roborovskii]|uniref:NADH dehydrogenase [ubiquinone] 1 alpha subcomplex subunit 12 n=1 Tax=Phodopus roborovskii TaxID=109678 RepID=A0AAU9ZFN0_PHORO|nr:Ndufa12 [Phodopus roborovskii]